DINECVAIQDLCKNFGSCVNTKGSYFCNCINGTFGDHCEENPDNCQFDANGVEYPYRCNSSDPLATCTDGFDAYSCNCGTFWTGRNCETDVDECALSPTPCVNFGTCRNTIGHYACDCINGTS
ncbi:hypothetical protein PFISCL1PPCAC_26629, partial [Pristionchus fissidentatus]